MEDTVRLRRIKVPYELTIGEWSRWGHHLRGDQSPWPYSISSRRVFTYAIDPFRIEQRLVVVRRLIEPLPLHVQEITSLERNSTDAADFIGADGASQRNLASHRSATDDRRLQAQFLDHGGDAADVGIFVVGVRARVVTFVLQRKSE